MADYDVKAACEELQRKYWPEDIPYHSQHACFCPQLQAAHDAGKAKGGKEERGLMLDSLKELLDIRVAEIAELKRSARGEDDAG